MSGIYNIGKSTQADFQSFSEAIDSLSTYGVSGPVIIQVDSGIYYEQITIPPIVGSSDNHNIRFKGLGSKTVFSFTKTTGMNAPAIALQGCRYITFDSLHIYAGSTTTGLLFGIHMSQKTSNITIKHCKLKVPIGVGSNLMSSGNIYSSNAKGHNADSIIIDNNEFIGGSNSIFLQNSSSNYMTQLVIQNNRFLDFSFASANLWYANNIVFDGNVIVSEKNAIHPRGVIFQHSRGRLSCQSNDIRLSGANFIYGIAFKNGNMFSHTQPAICANNFVTQLTESQSSAYKTRGIFFEGAVKNMNIYHNSVQIRPRNQPTAVAFDLNNKSGTDSIRIVNNHFVNKGSGYPISLYTAGRYIVSDYNNLICTTSVVGMHNGTAIHSLANWHSTTRLDSHSVSMDPLFDPNGDLHIDTSLYMLNGQGIYIDDVPFDIDGQSRDQNYPDIGADEFAIAKDLAVMNLKNDQKNWCKNAESLIVSVGNHGFSNYVNIGFVLHIIHMKDTITHYATIQQLNAGDTAELTFNNITALPKGNPFQIIVYALNSKDLFVKNDTLVTSLNYVENIPQIELGNDTVLHSGQRLLLQVPMGYRSYLWSDGSTSTGMIVSHEDLATSNTYWVQVTDANSCSVSDTIQIHSITGINETEKLGYEIFPNPAHSIFTISMNNPALYQVLELLDSSGKIVQTWNLGKQKQLEIDASQFDRGLYYLKISGRNSIQTKKLILH